MESEHAPPCYEFASTFNHAETPGAISECHARRGAARLKPHAEHDGKVCAVEWHLSGDRTARVRALGGRRWEQSSAGRSVADRTVADLSANTTDHLLKDRAVEAVRGRPAGRRVADQHTGQRAEQGHRGEQQHRVVEALDHGLADRSAGRGPDVQLLPLLWRRRQDRDAKGAGRRSTGLKRVLASGSRSRSTRANMVSSNGWVTSPTPTPGR